MAARCWRRWPRRCSLRDTQRTGEVRWTGLRPPGERRETWWRFSVLPMASPDDDRDGEVAVLVVTVEDVTGVVRERDRAADLSRAEAAAARRLQGLAHVALEIAAADTVTEPDRHRGDARRERPGLPQRRGRGARRRRGRRPALDHRHRARGTTVVPGAAARPAAAVGGGVGGARADLPRHPRRGTGVGRGHAPRLRQLAPLSLGVAAAARREPAARVAHRHLGRGARDHR
nr:hypothetical protein [Angustibacter aerolatus]